MKLKAVPNLKGSIAETSVSIEAFGGSGLSGEEEKELLEDLNITINYGKIIFERFVKVDDHGNPSIVAVDPESDTEPDGDRIVLTMPFETHEFNADTELKFSVDIRTLQNEDFSNFKYISDPIILAKSMCIVFEDCVISYIQDQYDVAKLHKNDFETVRYYII